MDDASPAAAPPKGSRRSAAGGVLFLLLIVGTVVYAIVAQASDPPLEPSRIFMRWQALWNDGRYGVKYNFAVTWISLLIALFGPVGLVAMSVGAVKAAREQPVFPADWRRLTWKHRDRAARLRLGIGLTGIAVIFGAVCIVDPTLLSPVGFLAQIGLILWPFTVIAGPVLLVDELLPEHVVVGPVAELKQTHVGATQYHFHVRLGERHFSVPEALWRQLQEGATVALQFSGGMDSLRAAVVRPGERDASVAAEDAQAALERRRAADRD